jgi:hypothetical protein
MPRRSIRLCIKGRAWDSLRIMTMGHDFLVKYAFVRISLYDRPLLSAQYVRKVI